MVKEVWRPVRGFEGYYEVSDQGSVRSIDRVVEATNRTMHIRGKVLTPCLKKEGYLAVGLYRDGREKRMYVHRMVAEAFVPRPEGCDYVDHINCVRDDPRAENLRWVTASENVRHSIDEGHYDVDRHREYLSSEHARRRAAEANRCPVVRDDGVIYGSVAEAAEAMGYKTGSVLSRHLNGKAWSVRGHTFEYLRKPRTAKPSRRVRKVDLKTGAVLDEYDSAADAIASVGSTGILHCLAGDAKSSCGFGWEYVSD